MEINQLRSSEIRPTLQKIPLRTAVDAGGFVANLLEQRFKFTFLERTDQSWIIGLDLELIDRHRQLEMAIQIEHFSIFQNLIARVSELLAGSPTFHLVD